MLALSGVICFLRQRCAFGGRFPGGLTLGSGSHLVLFDILSHASLYLRPLRTNASWCLSIFLAEEKIAEPGRGKAEGNIGLMAAPKAPSSGRRLSHATKTRAIWPA